MGKVDFISIRDSPSPEFHMSSLDKDLLPGMHSIVYFSWFPRSPESEYDVEIQRPRVLLEKLVQVAHPSIRASDRSRPYLDDRPFRRNSFVEKSGFVQSCLLLVYEICMDDLSVKLPSASRRDDRGTPAHHGLPDSYPIHFMR